MAEAKPCVNCRDLSKRRVRGLCDTCYRYYLRNRKMRPKHLGAVAPAPRDVFTPIPERQCPRCGEWHQPKEWGGLRRFKSTRLDLLCVACDRAETQREMALRAAEREALLNDPDFLAEQAEQRLKARLGKYELTHDEFDAMRQKQEDRCAICGRVPERGLVIDHCHTTGRVRGLLCGPCNTSLGGFADNPWVLLSAVCYLTDGHAGHA